MADINFFFTRRADKLVQARYNMNRFIANTFFLIIYIVSENGKGDYNDKSRRYKYKYKKRNKK